MTSIKEMTEEQKDVFFEIIKKLPKEIYPKNGSNSEIEKMNGGVNRIGLISDLSNEVKYGNIFLRIVKNIIGSTDYAATKEEIITFYNNPKNEKLWKKKQEL